MSIVLTIIVMVVAPMMAGIVLFLTVIRKKNAPRADGSMPKLGDADLFQRKSNLPQRKSSQRKSSSKSTPEEDIFKIPDSTF